MHLCCIGVIPFCILQTETHVSGETLVLDNLIETILQWDSRLKLNKCNTYKQNMEGKMKNNIVIYDSLLIAFW